MTPKEKAEELMSVYSGLIWGNTMFTRKERNKRAALIAVDEIQGLPVIQRNNNKDAAQYDYWQLVKEEIQKL